MMGPLPRRHRLSSRLPARTVRFWLLCLALADLLCLSEQSTAALDPEDLATPSKIARTADQTTTPEDDECQEDRCDLEDPFGNFELGGWSVLPLSVQTLLSPKVTHRFRASRIRRLCRFDQVRADRAACGHVEATREYRGSVCSDIFLWLS
mgnify:CR=1 FL=1|jgi:hypothetical protein